MTPQPAPGREAILKLLLFGILLYGFLWLWSVGSIEQETAEIGGKVVKGVKRSFTHTEDQ